MLLCAGRDPARTGAAAGGIRGQPAGTRQSHTRYVCRPLICMTPQRTLTPVLHALVDCLPLRLHTVQSTVFGGVCVCVCVCVCVRVAHVHFTLNFVRAGHGPDVCVCDPFPKRTYAPLMLCTCRLWSWVRF